MVIYSSCRKLFKEFNYFTFSSFYYRRMCNLPTVCVKKFEQEETMKISFKFGDPKIPMQNFTFMRSKDEKLEFALTRIKSKIQSSVLTKSSKKKKKSSDSVDEVLPEFNIVLMKNGVKIEEDTKNIDAWTSETDVVINNQTYKIIINPPTVIDISLPKRIVSSLLVYPKVNLEFCSVDDSIFKWYRQSDDGSVNIHDDDTVREGENGKWKFISQGFLYNVCESDVGFKLRVMCVPQSGDKSGEKKAAISENAVLSIPKKFPFEDRHNYTRDLTTSGRYICFALLFSTFQLAGPQCYSYIRIYILFICIYMFI